MALGAFDPKIREVTLHRFRQSIGFAVALRAESVVLHTGFDSLNKRDLADRYFAQFVPSLRAIAGEAAGKGLRLLVENTFESSPDLILDAVRAAGADNVGLLFDVAHHHLYGTTPLDDWLARWAGRVEEVHITDNNGDWDYHLAPGKGTIDFGRFFAALKALSLRPVYTFKPHDIEAFADTMKFIQAHADYFA
jgi:sugar phosphate isomerase/epimerase